MNDEEWAYWVNLEVWTLKEAILLLEKKNPKDINLSLSDFFHEIEDLAIRANIVGKLRTVNNKPLCRCMRTATVEEAKNMTRPGSRHTPFHYCRRDVFENEASNEAGIRPVVFLMWAQDNDLPLNQHLMLALDKTNTYDSLSKPQPIKNSVTDKIRCQAIAQCLWDDNPKRTIASIITDKKIQKFGNGAQYEEKTLRGWVRSVDPRPPSEKTGRPKKETPPDS